MLQAQQWSVHDHRRPPPPEVDPGSSTRPPADAVVLFDGRDLSRWRMKNGAAAASKVEDGYFEVVPGSGDLTSVAGFGDCQQQDSHASRGGDEQRLAAFPPWPLVPSSSSRTTA